MPGVANKELNSAVTDYRKLLPGVPNIESPFFEHLFDKVDHVTRQIAHNLHTYGCALIRYPKEGFEEQAQRVCQNLKDKISSSSWQTYQQHGIVSHEFVQENAWTFQADVRQLAGNPRILDLLSTLYGRRAWPCHTTNYAVAVPQALRSEASYLHSAPERFMCTIWLALEDIQIANSPLQVFTGSQSWPVYHNEQLACSVSHLPHSDVNARLQQVWQALLDQHKLSARQFTLKRGEALILAANTLHRTDAQIDQRLSRWLQVTHYLFDDCAYYCPVESDIFNGKIAFMLNQDIATGLPKLQHYVGHEIEPAFIRKAYEGNYKEPEFNPRAYLAANPDVAQSGMNPYEHYLRFGRYEGRKLQPELWSDSGNLHFPQAWD